MDRLFQLLNNDQHPSARRRALKSGDAMTTSPSSLESLPDDVIHCIGTSVATLCGIQDFVRLSQSSKRFKKLLLDSDETVAEIIRIRTSELNRSMRLLQSSPKPISVHGIEELTFLEIVARYSLLEENRILGTVHCHNEDDIAEIFDTLDLHLCLNMVVLAVERLRPLFPTMRVLIESHSGTTDLSDEPDTNSFYRGCVVYKQLMDHLVLKRTDPDWLDGEGPFCDDKFSMRAWDTKLSEKAARTKHPYGRLARKGKGWVEIFLKLERADGATALELPPRPEYYGNDEG